MRTLSMLFSILLLAAPGILHSQTPSPDVELGQEEPENWWEHEPDRPPLFAAHPFFWFASVDGDIVSDNSALAGTTVDIGSDLGLGDTETEIGIELELNLFTRHRLRGTYVQFEESGTERINSTFTFNGNVFNATNVVDSEIEWTNGRIVYDYGLWRSLFLQSLLTLRVGLSLNYMRWEGSLDNDTTGASVSEKITMGLPLLHGSFDWSFHERASVYTELSGISARSGDTKGTVYEWRFIVRGNVWDRFDLGLGYQITGIDAEDEDGNENDEVDITLGGLFFEASAKF